MGSFCYASLARFSPYPSPGFINNGVLRLPPGECLPHFFSIYPTLPLRQGLDEILPPHRAFLTLPAHQAPRELTDAAHWGLSRHGLRCESAGSLRLTRPVM